MVKFVGVENGEIRIAHSLRFQIRHIILTILLVHIDFIQKLIILGVMVAAVAVLPMEENQVYADKNWETALLTLKYTVLAFLTCVSNKANMATHSKNKVGVRCTHSNSIE